MNRENLQRMADHIRTIPQERFDMEEYRPKHDRCNTVCSTVGCIIGLCTILDSKPLPLCNDDKDNKIIDFERWSVEFTELPWEEWRWCFHGSWKKKDNTPEGAALRIEWLLNNGLPIDWYDQLYKHAPLCYLPQA